MNRILIAILLFLSILQGVFAQENPASDRQEIDPSKPTNLYTQINTAIEYRSGESQDLMGVRTNFQYAFDPDNLLLAEVPFLYNNRTDAFGIADIRVRYFRVVKRNITPRFIAVAPFADVTLPTGSFKNGLGTSSWSLAGGVVFGFIVSKNLSLFPGASYVHITKLSTDLIPEDQKYNSHGIGLQFNASYMFNKSTFLFINPTPTFLRINDSWKTIWSGEVNINKIIKPNKFKVNAYWGPDFTNHIHVFRAGCTFFL